MGLNPTDYKAMSVLERSGPLSAGELSKLTGLATASVTDLIDRLSAKGYVQRERDTVDRRRVVIRPVVERVRDARRYFASTAQSLDRLFSDFRDDELEIIADFLRRNAERLRQETDKVEQIEAMQSQEVSHA
jgi:DNA-binding MarR family transcriptional regulator